MSFLCCNLFRLPVKGERAAEQTDSDDNLKRDLQPVIQPLMAVQTAKEGAISSYSWNSAIENKLKGLNKEDAILLQQLCCNDNVQSSMTFLRDQYQRSKGVSSGLRDIEPIIHRLDSFNNAITSFIQASTPVGMLVWGSVQLVLTWALKYNGMVEQVTAMLDQLTSTMPRSETYLGLFPTLKMRLAMESLYSGYIEFCLATVKFFSSKPQVNMLRFLWSDVEKDFQKTLKVLNGCQEEFEAEARLAATIHTVQWQKEMSGKILDFGGDQFITNGLYPRNRMFCGREKLLQELHQALTDHSSNEKGVTKSSTLYGLGGVGKTQIALEYSHRYRHAYSHIFWVRGESDVSLGESFTAISRTLGCENSGKTIVRSAEAALQWFNSTSNKWLVVYDNVESFRTLRNFWPNSPYGAALITSQKADKSALTSSNFKVRPFDLQEGSTLILRHLQRDETERQDAEALSAELQGLPLAIEHYIGLIGISNKPLSQILTSFQRSGETAELWSCDSSTTSLLYYEKTLDTVWDQAFQKLSPAARHLLDILAFLQPDEISEEMLLADHNALPLLPGLSREFSLSTLISDLQRRNLIDRNVDASGKGLLHIHRVLQRGLRHKLDRDPDNRQDIFNKALDITRQSLPSFKLTNRATNLISVYERHVPHVLHLMSFFKQSDPPIEGSVKFVGLLSDSAGFLFQQHLAKQAMDLALLGETVLFQIAPDEDANPLLADVESLLALFEKAEGINGRLPALDREKRVVKIREKVYSMIPEDQRTLDDEVDLGRAWNDLGWTYLDLEDYLEAETWIVKALNHYRSLRSEEQLRFRYSMQYRGLSFIRVYQNRLQDAIQLANRAYDLCVAELGENDSWSSFVEFGRATILQTAGNLLLAIEKHTAVLASRIRLFGEEHPDVATSYYWLGIAHQAQGDFEKAEVSLRHALSLKDAADWNVHCVSRAQYQLSRILNQQGRHHEAKSLELLAGKSQLDNGAQMDANPEERERIYDLMVSLPYGGRSTGYWKSRALEV